MTLTKHYAPLMIPVHLHDCPVQREFECYLPTEVDERDALKDAEIAELKLELEASRADVNSLGLAVVNIDEIVEDTEDNNYRPAGHASIQRWCNAVLPIATQQGFQACNVCGEIPLPGTGRCFEHDSRTERSAQIRELLHTALSFTKGGFKLPDWWLPKVRAALLCLPIPGYDEAMELAKQCPETPQS